MDAQTSWSRSIVGISNPPQRLSDSRSWLRQMLYDDWRIAHEEEQFCVEASAVIDGRSEEGSKAEGVAVNQLINVAVAEKVSALRTEEYFAERAAKGDIKKALRMLKRAGKGNAPVARDELPEKMQRRRRSARRQSQT